MRNLKAPFVRLSLPYHIKHCLSTDNHIMPCLSHPFPSLTLVFLSDIRIAFPRHTTLFIFRSCTNTLWHDISPPLCLVLSFVLQTGVRRRPHEWSLVFCFPPLQGGARDMSGRSPVKTLHEPQKKHLEFGRRFRGAFLL